jgi:hypothetical protein
LAVDRLRVVGHAGGWLSSNGSVWRSRHLFSLLEMENKIPPQRQLQSKTPAPFDSAFDSFVVA